LSQEANGTVKLKAARSSICQQDYMCDNPEDHSLKKLVTL
jgi:hypothetical protein